MQIRADTPSVQRFFLAAVLLSANEHWIWSHHHSLKCIYTLETDCLPLPKQKQFTFLFSFPRGSDLATFLKCRLLPYLFCLGGADLWPEHWRLFGLGFLVRCSSQIEEVALAPSDRHGGVSLTSKRPGSDVLRPRRNARIFLPTRLCRSRSVVIIATRPKLEVGDTLQIKCSSLLPETSSALEEPLWLLLFTFHRKESKKQKM